MCLNLIRTLHDKETHILIELSAILTAIKKIIILITFDLFYKKKLIVNSTVKFWFIFSFETTKHVK